MPEQYDGGDEEQVQKKKSRQGQKDASERILLRNLMQAREFRDWIFKILEYCHTESTPFSDNPIRMAFLCGEMNIGQIIKSDVISATHEGYIKMLSERIEDE